MSRRRKRKKGVGLGGSTCVPAVRAAKRAARAEAAVRVAQEFEKRVRQPVRLIVGNGDSYGHGVMGRARDGLSVVERQAIEIARRNGEAPER